MNQKGVEMRLEYGNEGIAQELFTFLAESYKSELNEGRLIKLLHILEPIQTDEPEIQNILAEMKGSLVRITADTNKSLLQLGIEYMSLFRGTGPNPVFLYEAVNLGGEGLMYDEPYFEVKNFYADCGFEPEPDWIEPEDHISVECKYLAFLSEKMVQEHDDGDLEQAAFWQEQKNDFVREHFLQWVPQLSEQVIHNTSQVFYKQLGILTEAVCRRLSSDIN